MVPTWDLALVLKDLTGPPFESLQSATLNTLSLKKVLLLALASGISELGTCTLYQFMNPAYSLAQVTAEVNKGALNAIQSPGYNFVCSHSKRASHRRYYFCSYYVLYAHCVFILSTLGPLEQLFVCFGNHTKGQPVLKLRLSHWIVDVIAPILQLSKL